MDAFAPAMGNPLEDFMRLFVALEIPGTIRAEIARRTGDLGARGSFPKARWLRPEAMHLTLSFLGETDADLLAALDGALAPVFAASEPFMLRLHGVGAFPPRGKARVLWTGLVAAATHSPPEALLSLQTAVSQAVRGAAGVEPERRRFHPHLTLGRCKPAWDRGSFQRFVSAFGEPPSEVFSVGEGVLFESELGPSGASYRPVRRYPLRGGAGGG